jgi:hypothetical protein
MPEATGGVNGGAATFDALAELFLGEGLAAAPEAGVRMGGVEAGLPGAGPAPAPDTPAPVALEAVVVGHLPVRAGPWVTQYAGASAERDGRVIGLTRLMGGHAFVDVFGLPEDRRTGHERATVGEALAHARGLCDGWILQVEDLDEPALVSIDGLDAITLLTGVDDAAVVGAYRTIKALVGADRGRSPEGPGPAVRLAVMGAGAGEAAGALERVARASSAFLQAPIELAGWVERMEPRPGTPVFRGETNLSAEALLAALRGGAAEADPSPAPDAAVETTPIEPVVGPEPVASPGAEAIPSESSAPAAAPAPETPAPARGGSPDPEALARFVEGLETLDVPYPEGDVEFAVDGEGRLHLLSRDAGDGRSMAALAAADAWASKHADLLAMALRPRRIDWTVQAGMHLFTEDPMSTPALAGGRVRVYALVEAHGGAGWGAVRLG